MYVCICRMIRMTAMTLCEDSNTGYSNNTIKILHRLIRIYSNPLEVTKRGRVKTHTHTHRGRQIFSNWRKRKQSPKKRSLVVSLASVERQYCFTRTNCFKPTTYLVHLHIYLYTKYVNKKSISCSKMSQMHTVKPRLTSPPVIGPSVW